MSGIAGAIDLTGQRFLPADVLRRMADALRHRGPDSETLWQHPGVCIACRFEGPRPESANEIVVAFDGHLTSAGTEPGASSIVKLWNLHHDELFDKLRGQFAFALHDPQARRVILARDRFGIAPLFHARQDNWLLFASEIKALLASGMVPAAVDRRGINHLFTFLALPGPITCFAGISSLLPGQFLDIRLDVGPANAVRECIYWRMDFPNRGAEERGASAAALVDDLEQTLTRAVERQLDAGVPTVCYLSGGIDSSIVAALAGKIRGEPLPAYTIRIDDPVLDESGDVALIAQRLGCKPVPITCGPDEIFAAFPRLIRACEAPVIDMACSALLLLAERVHADGYQVALSGEVADDWLLGYPWYKFHKLLGMLDVIPGVPLSRHLRQLFLRITKSPRFSKEMLQRTRTAIGGHSPWLDVWGLMSMSKLRFYSESMREVMLNNVPYEDLGLDLERMRRWHPLNQGIYLGARVHVPGLLLPMKNDRPSMLSAVQPRFPFLDEDLVAFLASLHPRWKLHGFRDKYLLRLLADRWLPRSVVWRSKSLFRAPARVFSSGSEPPYVDQLLGEESLRRTDYFDPAAVAHWREAFKTLRPGTRRNSLEMGLAGVLSTQLWHHLFIDSTLCDLPAE